MNICFTMISSAITSNKVMNLTAITEEKEIEIKHFIDSLESAEIINNEYLKKTQSFKNKENNLLIAEPLNKDTDQYNNEASENSFKVIDIGTGAGFPGIPLSIIFPKMSFYLIDSIEKRINFINDFCKKANIQNVIPEKARAEEIGQGKYRESFDICVSRAVSSLPVLLEYCLPLIRKDGIVILYKSGQYKDEIKAAENALNILHGNVENVIEFKLPDSDYFRSLVIIRKTDNTPAKYPRRIGKPEKSPL